MKCPKCKGATTIIEGRSLLGGIRKRVRKCKACGHYFDTYEFKEADVKDILAERELTSKYNANSLCWSCKRATGFCPWSAEFKPVQGWVAEPTEIKSDSKGKLPVVKSYEVKSCPLFEKDERR